MCPLVLHAPCISRWLDCPLISPPSNSSRNSVNLSLSLGRCITSWPCDFSRAMIYNEQVWQLPSIRPKASSFRTFLVLMPPGVPLTYCLQSKITVSVWALSPSSKSVSLHSITSIMLVSFRSGKQIQNVTQGDSNSEECGYLNCLPISLEGNIKASHWPASFFF